MTLDQIRAALTDLLAKWATDAETVQCMGYYQQAERIDDCRNELHALLAALPVEPEPASSAVGDVLRRIPEGMESPEVCLESDGDICLDWNKSREAALSISVRESTGRVGWSCLVGAFRSSGHCTLPEWPDDLAASVTAYVSVPEPVAAPAPTCGQWRPIETAPKDGTDVTIVSKHGYVYRAHWDSQASFDRCEHGPGWQVWSCEDNWYSFALSDSDVTHWLPLPEVPRG